MSSPRILATMVTRNEAGRYLACALDWLNTMVDGAAVYDDGSTDATIAVATAHGALARRRPESEPCFLEDESGVREAAWRWMELACKPAPGDWVLAVDADEIVVGCLYEEATLRLDVADASRAGLNALLLPVAEVFGLSDAGLPLVRTDGYWGAITACRLVAWQPDATFRHPGRPPKHLGGGSVPLYAEGTSRAEGLTVLHYGYADAADRQAKYDRYRGRKGHNPAHIESILAPPTLVAFDGRGPAMTRGAP